MGANNVQQALLDAMDLLSKKAANSTNAAITIRGEVVEEIDSGIHQYAISYGGTIYKDVYSTNLSYPPSTIVYVLIPDGNFDNPKLLLGAVDPNEITYTDQSSTDIHIPITSNLFGEEGSIDLRSWVDESKNVAIDTNNFGLIFSDYLKTYRNMLFSAYVKTEIDADHKNTGNYGLILSLPFIQKTAGGGESLIWKEYIMDVSTMPGTPYSYNEYQKVDLYYDIDDTLTYDNNRTPFIQAFTQGFGYTEPRTDIDYDIHIKNISLKMVDVLSEEEASGYHLSIVASEGNYFLNGKYVHNKTLKPVLKINAKETNLSSWDCYWFIEDSSINISSEGYLPIGGLGWKCINRKTNITYDAEGNKTFQYVTTDKTLAVQDTDVISSLKYKCTLTKDDVIVSGSLELKNLNSRINIELISATGSNSFIENIGNVRLIARIYYPGVTDIASTSINLSTLWQRFDKDGNYLDNDFYTIERYNDRVDGWFETGISYPCSILEKLNTVNCTFYSTITNNGTTAQNNLGTASIIVTSTKDLTYGVTIDGGDVLYKYDADGDSPLVANYDGPASSKITGIPPISFRVFKPDGSELNDVEYLYAHYKWSFPKRSMMKLEGYTAQELKNLEQDDNYYYITGYGKKSINYTILPTFNKKKMDNSILLSIEIDGNQISDSTNPKFLKDGEGGTNGSKYATVLTYNDYAYGERDGQGRIRKLQAVYIGGGGWRLYDVETGSLVAFDSPKLAINVYKDGEKITSGYRVSWGMFDSTETNPCFTVTNGALATRANWIDAETVFCSIVECAVTIQENSDTNSQEVVYAYYPIEITRLLNGRMANKVIPNLDGGFEQVLYASDGTNPQYDNTNAFECVDNLYNDDIGDYYDYIWSTSGNLKISAGAGTGPSATIKPVTKFDNGETKNFVKVRLSLSADKRSEVQEKITLLTSEISKTQDKISFYQNNKINILDFEQKFSYNIYEENLKNSKQVLNYRYELINYIPKLKEILENINTYCIERNIKIADFNYTRYYTSYNNNLNSAYRSLYLLGYSRELSDLSDLASSTIVVDTAKITAGYGAAVAQQLNSFAQMWTALINKYQATYVKIVQQASGQYVLQSEVDNLTSIYQDLGDLTRDSDLAYLATAHDNNDPEPEFVQLQSTLSAIYNRVVDYDNGDLTSYSAIVNNLLKAFDNALKIYQNTEYQEKYYNEIDTQLNETLTDLQGQKASYEAYLLPAQTDYIIHIKPIVMVFNRYELSNINGWDGSKLYIDSTNNEYLLAPQVGAGAKENGLFTGVLMGVKKFNASNTQHIGLFGYSSGIQSFFMNAEDGSTIFGKSGYGQFIADPSNNKALIYSSNYWKNYNNDGKPSSYTSGNENKQGMLIDLTTPAIKFGSGNFSVDADGYLVAKGGGEIAGWKIGNTQLYSNVTPANGRITLESADSGKIYSHSHSRLDSTNTGFYLSADGISIGNTLRASSDNNGSLIVGKLNGNRHWTISGNATNSYIAYGTTDINTGANSVYVGTDGISLGTNKFYVTNDGTLTAKAGTIGGWTITNTSLTSGSSNGITISSTGNISSKDWEIKGDGTAVFRNVTITSKNYESGSQSTLNWGDNFYVDPDGNLTCKNANVKGTVNATAGYIGGWKIDGTGMEYGDAIYDGSKMQIKPSLVLFPGDVAYFAYRFPSGVYKNYNMQNTMNQLYNTMDWVESLRMSAGKQGDYNITSTGTLPDGSTVTVTGTVSIPAVG